MWINPPATATCHPATYPPHRHPHPHPHQSKTKDLQDQGKKINLSLSEMAQFFMKVILPPACLASTLLLHRCYSNHYRRKRELLCSLL
jgi:hypothetical protein